MFKCKECGTEYEIKPDYCDCGNDTFDEIIINTEPEIKPVISNTNTSTEQTVITSKEVISNQKNKLNSSDIKPYAIIIFILCLVLSVVVILFAWNSKPSETLDISENTINSEQKPIPSIEKIWNNKLPETSAVQVKKTSDAPTTVKQNITTEVKKASQPTPQLQKQSTITAKKEQTKSVTLKTTTPKTTAAKTTTTTPQTQSTTTVQKTVSATPQEIANYKIKLRNHIASKISFASVVGDGSCTFSFSVASNGELTGKKPVSLSDNESLNEAVYNALRQVYSYNTPPAGYKSEALKLTVKMYNNNFEVSLN